MISLEARETETGLNASFLLDGEDRILEGNRDAEVFFEKPLEEVRKSHLHDANPSLYGALKELLGKTRRGRGIEDYAMAYKVGKRLMRLNIDMSPYPLEALGETGILVNIKSAGLRPSQPRRVEEEPVPCEETEAPEPAGLAGFLDSLVEPAFLLDLEANFSFVNAAMCALLGQEGDELLGRPLAFFLRGEGAKKSLERLVEAARKAPWRGELEFSRRDGGTACVAVTVSMLEGKRGGKGALLCMGRDNTTECRLRREREDELKRLWNMLERVGLAVVCFTPDLRVTLLSRSAEEMLSTSSDRAVGAPLSEILPAGMAEELFPLLERAVSGEVLEEERVRIAGEGKGGTFFVSVRPAHEANGVTREFMAVIRESGREAVEAEEAEAERAAARRSFAVMELAAASRDEEEFLRKCLEMMREELSCDAAAAFVVERGEAVLRAGLGLEEGEAEAVRRLRLRPGHARLCGMMEMLRVEVHGGVPRRGWDEVVSLIEKSDAVLPLLRERRWKNLVSIPLRGEGETAGLIAMADCDAVKLDHAGARAFAVVGETAAAALAAMKKRPRTTAAEGREASEADCGEEREEDRGDAQAPRRLIMPVITRKASVDREHEPAEEDSASRPARVGAAVGGVHAGHPEHEHEHDYFEIAREAKGREDAGNLALFADRVEERAVYSSRGIDLGEMLWELKEHYARRIPRGEIFLELEEDLPRLHSDRRLLREVLDHLLDNAVRHSPPGAPVILGAERWGDEVLLRVEDQGPGIPEEVVEEIMRGDANGGDAGIGEGAGVKGLILCRRYVSAMGGTLSIKCKPEEGTTVLVRLRVLPFVGEGT